MTKRDSSHELRPRGFYPTPRAAFLPLVPHLDHKSIGEPCAGDGALCDLMFEAGYSVVLATDIVPSDPRVVPADALEITPENAQDVRLWVTNPPWPERFKQGDPTVSIITHLCGMRPGWFLLSADFCHNVYAAPLMAYCKKIVSVGRVQWIPDSKGAGFDNCAWYYFNFEEVGNGLLTFIPNKGKQK